MYYFNRQDGLQSIPSRSELPEVRSWLTSLCHAWWDVYEGQPITESRLDAYRKAARHAEALVWDWAMIGIALRSRDYEIFRTLFIELLYDDDQNVRRRMANKIARVGGEAGETLLAHLLGHADPAIRNVGYRLLIVLDNDAGATKKRLMLLRGAQRIETEAVNTELLKEAIDLLDNSAARARQSATVFDWDAIEGLLVQAVEAGLAAVVERHPDLIARGCLLYCGNFGFVTVQLAKGEGELFDAEGDPTDPLNWDYDNFISDFGGEEAFEAIWAPVRLKLIESEFDEEAPWAEGENIEHDFIAMTCRAAMRLRRSKVVDRLKRTADFIVLALSEAEEEQMTLSRLRELERLGG